MGEKEEGEGDEEEEEENGDRGERKEEYGGLSNMCGKAKVNRIPGDGATGAHPCITSAQTAHALLQH